MNEGLISRRYAKALLMFAQKRGAAKEVYLKMKLFEDNYIAHPDLHRALMNPVLTLHDKELLLSTAIGIDPSEDYMRGIRLILRNHREMYVRTICLMYQKLYREANHILRVEILTATKLDVEELTKIHTLVKHHTKDKIEFVHKIDPSIIGGFVLKVGSHQLDASILQELKVLRLNFLKR